MFEHVVLYDTTLHDGAQQEGVSLSVADKPATLPIPGDLGAGFVGGGWLGAIPKDIVFFERVRPIRMRHVRLVAFGAMARPGITAAEDRQARAPLDSGIQVITLVVESDVRHVKRALYTSEDEDLCMVRGTIAFLSEEGIDVVMDLEHFFSGFAHDLGCGTSVMVEATLAGVAAVILCDMNGGSLPSRVSQAMRRVRAIFDDAGCTGVTLGIHACNDTGCAVTNTTAAVEAGARQIQGAINGYEERTGSANLLTRAANLQLKCGFDVIPEELLVKFESVSRRISELVNIAPLPRGPYADDSAFAHKAGLHTSAIRVDPDLYQHIDPAAIGNGMRMLVSEMAGKSSIKLKAEELGTDLESLPNAAICIAVRVKKREVAGYTYDAADASFELLALNKLGRLPRFLRVESWKVMSQKITEVKSESFAQSEAMMKTHTDRRHIRTAEGNGSVGALDRVLRHVMTRDYPMCMDFELADFKMHVLGGERAGTDATIHVFIEMSGGHRPWWTVGIGTDVVETSWEALSEAYW